MLAARDMPEEMKARDAWTLCIACGQAVASSAVAIGYAAAAVLR